MSKDKTSTAIIDEYLNYHNTYVKKYGPKVIIAYQIGSFSEMLALEDEGPDLKTIADILNVVLTRRDKRITTISKSNPMTLGWPLVSNDKHISILINAGYTVIMVEQNGLSSNGFRRKVTGIYSPSTYISPSNTTIDTNYSISIIMQYEKQKIGADLLSIGMSAIDITTAKCLVHESHSTSIDNEIALDELSRFIAGTQPKEILLYHKNISKIDDIIDYLQINKDILRLKTSYDQKYEKISYQNEFYKNVYKNNTSQLTPIEYLELDKFLIASTSLVLLMDFLIDHNNNLVDNLNVPEFFIDSTHLILGNNAIYQLNLVESDSYNYASNTKFKSLYDIVNNASTNMGKRYIKSMLISPLTNTNEIEFIYNNVDLMLKDNRYIEVEKILSNISDIEKLKRKMGMNLLQPYEMSYLMNSITAIFELINLLNNKDFKKIIPDKKILEQLKGFQDETNNLFIDEQLKTNILNNIKTSFFKPKIYSDLDKLLESASKDKDFMEKLCGEFAKLIGKKNTNNKPAIAVQSTKTEGYFLLMSSKRYDDIIEKLKKNSIKIDGEIITEKSLRSTTLKSRTKVFFGEKKEKIEDQTMDEKIATLTYKYYIENMEKLSKNYNDMFDKIISFITKIDYYKSNAKTAKLYNYSRPKIVKKDFGFINVKKLRHPIVERILEHEYIPADFSLGNDDLKGMLLYGINASGKSISMKAVGIAIIMAQCGMYTASESLECSIYRSIYTRITANDNLFKSLSSFTLEMTELNAIIKRSDKNMLVLADEACKSTEHISGTAIVASTLIKLSQSQSSFIFATHLHELTKLKSIKELKNVKPYHLSVEIDRKTNTLIYDRTLKEGSGEAIYGIIVAESIIKNKEFIDNINMIKNELMETHDSLISGKTSNYNSGIYLYKCELCGTTDKNSDYRPLETHHINFQKDCKDGFVKIKPHLKKNDKANLVVVCSKCHDKIHTNELVPEGYVMTSKGKKLKMKN
jgi:DNA mismatch repair protein MutS